MLILSFTHLFLNLVIKCFLMIIFDNENPSKSHGGLVKTLLAFNFPIRCCIFFNKCVMYLSFSCNSIVTLSGMSGIVKNLKDFTKNSGKCQESCWVFSNIRKMSGILYDTLSGDIPYFMFFRSMLKKSWIYNKCLKHFAYFQIRFAYHIYIFSVCIQLTLFTTCHIQY